MALYVKFVEKEGRPRTIRGFIKKYYSYRLEYSCARGYDTYHDPECTRLHCSRLYRSFDDLWTLVNTYYRPIPPAKMMHYLLTTKIPLSPMNGQERFAKPHLGICSGMGRIRFIPYSSSAFNHIDRKMQHSKFTWRELLTPLGINDRNQFEKYIKNNK